MSQAERISRIHLLLRTKGYVTVAELRRDFEVSRATVMRDIELMRDRLWAPIEYNPARNAYEYADDPSHPRDFAGGKFAVPGMWINGNEGYALLTALNFIAKIDPGGLLPYVTPFRMLLKNILSERAFPMRGFHKKVAIELPNLRPLNRKFAETLIRALVEELEVDVTWEREDSHFANAQVSLQKFVLSPEGWEVEFLEAGAVGTKRVDLECFRQCEPTGGKALLLEENMSNPQQDWDALRTLYEINRYGFPLWENGRPETLRKNEGDMQSRVNVSAELKNTRSLADAKELDLRKSQLEAPHIASLTRFVEKLREKRGGECAIPYFDPRDAGINAEVLFLLEAPGPKACRTNFVSRDNPDGTAENFARLCSDAKINRTRSVVWNVVPWYIGSKNRIRPARVSDIRDGVQSLGELLAILSKLKAIVLVGRKAQAARAYIESLNINIQIFECHHPSPMFVNREPKQNRKIIIEQLLPVRDFLDSE